MSDMQQEVETKGPMAPPTAVAKQEREVDDKGVIDWLDSFGEIGAFKVQTYRIKPEFVMQKGERIKADGYMGARMGPIEEEEIAEMYGGGTYELRVLTPNPKGKFVYFKSRRVEIPGRAKLLKREGEEDEASAPAASSAPANESTPLAQQAITVMRGLVEKAEERADQKGKGRDDIAALIEAATSPLLAQITSLNEDRKEARAEARALAHIPTSAPATEKLLDKMIDGEGARIDALRTQFDSERRQLATYWESQVQRAQDNAQRSIDQMDKAHERELRSVEKSHEQAMKTLESSHASALASLTRENARLERELGSKDKELIELRAQKSKTILDSFHEVREIKELMNEGKDGDEKEEGSTVERVINTIIGSGPVAAIASRIANAAPQQAAPPNPAQQQAAAIQAQIAAMPPRQPFTMNGKTYMKLESGQVVGPLKPKKQKPAVVTPTVNPETGEVEEAMPDIPAEDLAAGLAFLENAIFSRTEAKDFALTAKTMAPQIAGILRKFGADRLIKIMNPREDSAVFTQRGKSFIRDAAAALSAE